MILLRRYNVLVVISGMLFLSACMSLNNTHLVRMHEGAKPTKDIVRFVIPADIDLLKLDEESFKHSPNLSDGQYQLELLPGYHRFKVAYSKMWGSDALGSFVESDAFYFDVNTMAGNSYVFEHNGPSDSLDADWYDIDDIKIWLAEKNTGRKIKAISVREYGNIMSRYIFGNDKPLESGVPTARTKDKINTRLVEQNGINTNKPDQEQQKANKKLKFWWKIADVEQRNLFQDWLVTLEDLKVKKRDSVKKNAVEQLQFWWKLADLNQRKAFLLWVGE